MIMTSVQKEPTRFLLDQALSVPTGVQNAFWITDRARDPDQTR